MYESQMALTSHYRSIGSTELTTHPATIGTELTNYHVMDQIMDQLAPFIIKTVSEYVQIQINDVIATNLEKIMEKNIEIMDTLLEEKLEKIVNRFESQDINVDQTPIVVIEEMSKEEAKLKVKKFFEENGEDIYPSELSERLHIDYELIWEILRELEESGDVESG
jgi:hypothetical protein